MVLIPVPFPYDTSIIQHNFNLSYAMLKLVAIKVLHKNNVKFINMIRSVTFHHIKSLILTSIQPSYSNPIKTPYLSGGFLVQ